MKHEALRPGAAGRAIRWTLVGYLLFLVGMPLLALVLASVSDGMAVFLQHINEPRARAALWLSLWTAMVVAMINAVLGTATAWVLTRYRFRGRDLLAAMVDLPLAIPTLVTGVMLAVLYGPQSAIGRSLKVFGIEIIFAPPGILLALLFVTLPFVVRAVEPVLLELDPAEEEAALTLGASRWTTFRRIIWPALMPAATSGAIRSAARALGEFGSLVVVAGNIPFYTLTAPVFVFGEIESGAPRSAAAMSAMLLAIAIAMHAAAQWIDHRTGAHRG